MRVFVFLLFVGFSSYHINAETIIVTEEHLSKQFIAEKAANLLVRRISEKRQEQLGTIKENNVRIPLLPPISITIPFTDARLEFPLDPLLSGFYEHFDSSLRLAVSDDYTIDHNETFLTLRYGFTANEITISGNYSLGINVNFTYLGEIIPDFPIIADIVPFTGSGGYEVSLKNISIALLIEAELLPNGAIASVMSSFDEFSLGSLNFQFDNFLFNGEDGEWLLVFLQEILNEVIGGVSSTLKELLALLEPVLNSILNDLFEGCLVEDILDGDLSCTGLVPPPPTEGPTPEIPETTANTPESTPDTPEPTTTTPTTTTTTTTPSTTTTVSTTPFTTTSTTAEYESTTTGAATLFIHGTLVFATLLLVFARMF